MTSSGVSICYDLIRQTAHQLMLGDQLISACDALPTLVEPGFPAHWRRSPTYSVRLVDQEPFFHGGFAHNQTHFQSLLVGSLDGSLSSQ